MERRSFLKTVSAASVATVIPPPPYEEKKGIGFEQTNVEGIGIGIAVCDTLSNGFFGGQVIAVYGPESAINEAFLIHTFLYQLIAKGKRVDYVCSTGSLKSWEQRYLRRLGFESTNEMQRALNKSGLTDNLRIIDIDLGDPANQNWKDYRVQVKYKHPDSIIVDDVELIEEFRREKSMVKQLKQLAAEVQAPVFVLGALDRKRSRRYFTGLNLRSDFRKWSDVLISLVPKNVTDFKIEDITVGKRYLLDMKFIGVSCPCARHKGYGANLSVELVDYDLRFESL